MFVLGITGPSGAGKGTACEILKKFGYYHIDTDRLVPSLYPVALPELIRVFGPQVCQGGTVNKKELAAAAFKTKEGTDQLNSILHPLVMQEVRRLILQAEKEGYTKVSVDGAALIEAHGEKVCNKILTILTSREERFARVGMRDGISAEEIERRFSAQKPDEFYINNADEVIYNHTKEQLKTDLINILKEWDHE